MPCKIKNFKGPRPACRANMREREKARSKEVKERQVLVCQAIKVWKPNEFPNERWFLVDDTGQEGVSEYLNPDVFSLKSIAEMLIRRGNSFELILSPEIKVELIWLDGYFGRPAIPVEVNQLLPLENNDVEEFKKLLNGLGYSPVSNKK